MYTDVIKEEKVIKLLDENKYLLITNKSPEERIGIHWYWYVQASIKTYCYTLLTCRDHTIVITVMSDLVT